MLKGTHSKSVVKLKGFKRRNIKLKALKRYKVRIPLEIGPLSIGKIKKGRSRGLKFFHLRFFCKLNNKIR